MLVLLFVVIKSNPTCKITETNEVRVNVILLKVHIIYLEGASRTPNSAPSSTRKAHGAPIIVVKNTIKQNIMELILGIRS